MRSDETLGKPIHIIVVDTNSNAFKVVVNRFISLSNKFSLKLLADLEEQLDKPMTKMEFQKRTLAIQMKYDSDRLLSYAKFKYKSQ